MIEKKIIINNPEGINTRIAAVFVQTANQYTSNVWLEKENIRVNGKSIMGIISLALAKGDEVLLRVDGTDEEVAVSELPKVLENNRQ